MGKKFRFIHVADSHIGHSGNASRYNEFKSLRIQKVNEHGVNIRQQDINDAFIQVMDLAIQHKVDAVLHAGDGTDFWGYRQPHVLNFYSEQVTRLAPHGIHYLEIVGNHNLPKKSGVGCYLETLGRFENVRAVYKGVYEAHEIPGHNVVVHCVPSSFTQEVLDYSLEQARPVDGKINIGIGHFGVTSIGHYAENALNSLVVDLDSLIKCKMDYFALGDYHTPTDFGYNIRYSGSIERMGFGEIDIEPQVLLVEIDEDTKEVNVQALKLDVRDMIQLKTVDANDKSIEQINDLIESRLTHSDLTDKIVRLRVRNLPVHLKKLIDDQKIKELTESALYFKLEFVDKVNKTKDIRTSGTKFEGVLEGWNEFVDLLEDEASFDKSLLKQEGYNRLSDMYDDTVNA